jgi:hypothetical protein
VQLLLTSVLQDPQLQQAAALAGGSNVDANDPALMAAVHGRLLHVVPDKGSAGNPSGQASITPECLMVCWGHGACRSTTYLQLPSSACMLAIWCSVMQHAILMQAAIVDGRVAALKALQIQQKPAQAPNGGLLHLKLEQLRNWVCLCCNILHNSEQPQHLSWVQAQLHGRPNEQQVRCLSW